MDLSKTIKGLLESEENNLFQPRRVEERILKQDEKWKLGELAFVNYIKGYEIKKSDKYPKDIFYVKNNYLLFFVDENNNLLFTLDNFWSKFSKKYQVKRFILQDFLKRMIEKHLNIEIEYVICIIEDSFSKYRELFY